MTCFVYGYGIGSFDPAVPPTSDQEEHCRRACESLLRAGGLPSDSQWVGFVRDEPALKPAKFRQRQAASMLLAGLGPNTLLMAHRHDTIFRGVTDACEVLELAHSIGFRLMVLDFNVDTGTPHHLQLSLARMMKALRAKECRRTKEIFEYRKRSGIPAGGKPPIGWQLIRAVLDGNDQAYFAPDPQARLIAQFITEHYERWHGTSAGGFRQMAYWLNSQKIRRPDGRPWRKSAVHNWYRAAKAEFPLPNGRREAFPIPAGAGAGMSKDQRRRYIMPDDDD